MKRTIVGIVISLTWLGSLLQGGIVRAATMTVTAEPESSPTYPAGTSFYSYTPSGTFTSATSDPLGPFSDSSVFFKGREVGGGNTVYLFKLSFDESVQINNITLSGAAFNSYQGVNARLYLLDSTKSVLDEFVTAQYPYNEYVSYSFAPASARIGTTFYLQEVDGSTHWRYRDHIGVAYTAAGSSVPEPSAVVAWSSLAVVGLAACWRRRRKSKP